MPHNTSQKRAVNSATPHNSQNKKYKTEIKTETGRTEQDWTQLYIKFAKQRTGNIQDDIKTKQNAIEKMQYDKITPRDLHYRRMVCLLLQLNLLYKNEPDTYANRIEYLSDYFEKLINIFESKAKLPISIDTLNLLKKTQADFLTEAPPFEEMIKTALESDPTPKIMETIHRHYKAFITSSIDLEQPIDIKIYKNLTELCQKIPRDKRTIKDWTLLYVAFSKQKTGDIKFDLAILKNYYYEIAKDKVTPFDTVRRRAFAIQRQYYPLLKKLRGQEEKQKQEQAQLHFQNLWKAFIGKKPTNLYKEIRWRVIGPILKKG